MLIRYVLRYNELNVLTGLFTKDGEVRFMIKRNMYLDRIRPFIGGELIKVLTGIRRCGKSVMLQLIQEELIATGVKQEQIVTFNFEDMSLAHLLNSENLHEEVLARTEGIEGKVYLFFDEIQEVGEWERCINSLRVKLDCDIYITGSNAKLLSGELATHLTGRYVEFVIYPFSFAEFLELYGFTENSLTISEVFDKYIELGGIPYLANLQFAVEPSKLYLTELFNSIKLKDIVKRYNVREIDMLERIVAYITANIGTTFSATSLSRYLKGQNRKASVETILNYIRYGCDAYLFHKVPRQDLQGKAILAVNEKYYLADHGMREAVYGNNFRDMPLVLENIVFMEALRRGYEVYVGRIGEREIDFVCYRRGEVVYIQVSYLLASPETIVREFGVYEYIPDHYPKYVVTLDEYDMSRNGIKHRNIRDFLLSNEW